MTLFPKWAKAFALVLIVPALFAGCQNSSPVYDSSVKVVMDNQLDSASYALGVLLSRQLKDENQWEGVNYDLLSRAIFDYFQEDSTAPIGVDQAKEILGKYEKQNAAYRAVRFMEMNKTREGVVSLPSGLQYKVMDEGNGPKPVFGDSIQVHSDMYLTNGKLIHSSRESGRPRSFVYNEKSWFEGAVQALGMMKEGAEWELTIPPALGYGGENYGSIPANSVIIMKLSLLKVKKN